MDSTTSVRHALMRLPPVLTAMGERRSSFYGKVAKGLIPRPIKLGARAAALPAYEVDAINAARIRGASEDELRALVVKLHAQRERAGLTV